MRGAGVRRQDDVAGGPRPLRDALDAVGGVMGGAHHYEVTLGPLGVADAVVCFRLYCTSPSRERHNAYCSGRSPG